MYAASLLKTRHRWAISVGDITDGINGLFSKRNLSEHSSCGTSVMVWLGAGNESARFICLWHATHERITPQLSIQIYGENWTGTQHLVIIEVIVMMLMMMVFLVVVLMMMMMMMTDLLLHHLKMFLILLHSFASGHTLYCTKFPAYINLSMLKLNTSVRFHRITWLLTINVINYMRDFFNSLRKHQFTLYAIALISLSSLLL